MDIDGLDRNYYNERGDAANDIMVSPIKECEDMLSDDDLIGSAKSDAETLLFDVEPDSDLDLKPITKYKRNTTQKRYPTTAGVMLMVSDESSE